MGFFRKVAGFLGFVKDDAHEVKDEEEDDNHNNARYQRMKFEESGLPRKGFSVPVKVPVERPLGPVLVPCRSGDGGVQGLKWYTRRLKADEDGDIADEFLDEIPADDKPSSIEYQQTPFPRFKVNNSTRPAKVRTQVMSPDGKFQQYVECKGRLLLV